MTEFLKKITKADIRHILAVIVILGSLVYMVLLLFVKVPAENKDLVNIATGGVIVASMGAVLGFYFGASKKQDGGNNDEA